MANVNQVSIIGRLTRDPEVREISDTTKVAKFSLAVNHYYKDREGNRQEETDFIDCELFGSKNVDVLQEYATGGKELFVSGRLKQDKWVDKETEEKRTRLLVRVDDFQLLGGGAKKQNEEDAEESPAPKRQQKSFGSGKPKQSFAGRKTKQDDNIPF